MGARVRLRPAGPRVEINVSRLRQTFYLNMIPTTKMISLCRQRIGE
jgi:hypothetical protein